MSGETQKSLDNLGKAFRRTIERASTCNLSKMFASIVMFDGLAKDYLSATKSQIKEESEASWDFVDKMRDLLINQVTNVFNSKCGCKLKPGSQEDYDNHLVLSSWGEMGFEESPAIYEIESESTTGFEKIPKIHIVKQRGDEKN